MRLVETAPETSVRVRRQGRPLLVAIAGHGIEWFEFGVYGVLAAYIAAAVFPSDDPALSLLLTWTAYSTAFIVRPVGGIVLAHIGDRSGRRRSLFLTVLLMSGATAAMGFVPGYEAAGLAAPLCFVALRMLQGFAVGGEMSSAVSYVHEHTPVESRGRAASLLAAGTFGASFAGALLATLLSTGLGPEAMTEYGWRLLFLAAVPLGLIAAVLRRRAPETPEFGREPTDRAAPGGPAGTGGRGGPDGPRAPGSSPLVAAVRGHRGAMLRVSGVALLFNVALSCALGGFGNELLLAGMARSELLVVTCVAYAALVASILALARTSERWGSRRSVVRAALAMLVLVQPMLLLGSTGSVPAAALGCCAFLVPVGLLASVVYRELAGAFPASVRVTAGAIAFNAATALASLVPAATLGLRTALGFEHGLVLFLGIAIVVALLASSPSERARS